MIDDNKLRLYLVNAILVVTSIHLFGCACQCAARAALTIGLDLFALFALQRWTCLSMANVGRILRVTKMVTNLPDSHATVLPTHLTHTTGALVVFEFSVFAVHLIAQQARLWAQFVRILFA